MKNTKYLWVLVLLGIVALAFVNSGEEQPMAEDIQELVIETLEEGEGPEAKSGDTVSVHYTGTLLNGTKFDSSLDRGEPISFRLGAGMVIQGWDQGIAGMQVGEKRKLTIPAHLAYGANSPSPLIPPNSVLVFETELVAIQ